MGGSQLSEDGLEPSAEDPIAAVSEQAEDEVVPSAAKRADRPTPSPPSAGRGYDAFISYSHAADGTLAPAVQRGLESLAKPRY
jgi:hypothetical protein